MIKALFKSYKIKLKYAAFSFPLLLCISIILPQSITYAQVVFCGAGTTCASSGNTCLNKGDGAGTNCSGTANNGSVNGNCYNFYSAAAGGTNCRGNFRDACNCVDLTQGFTWTSDFFFGSNLTVGVGDGLAFVLRPNINNVATSSGGQIGYSTLTGPWVAVEFDTYQNPSGDSWGTDDPACQHTATYQSGSATAIAGPTCLGGGAFDARNATNTTYAISITWDPVAKTLAVRFNGVLKYTASIDLVAKFSGTTCVTAGVSTGTGGLSQNHRACNMNMTVIPLPVTLLKFTGEIISPNQVLLNWQTAQEINNKEFNVLRSPDSKNWETIAVVQGAGKSSSLQKYFHTDQISVNENKTIYYRLKQTDFDGQSEIFNIIAINPSDQYKFEIIPNPSKGKFKLAFGKNISGESIEYKIYNIQGKEVFPGSIEISENDILVNGENLPEGMYFINVIYNDVYMMKKLIVN